MHLSEDNLAGAARGCVDARRRAPRHDIAAILIGTARVGVSGHCTGHAGRAVAAHGAIRASTATGSAAVAEADRRALFEVRALLL